MTVLVSRRAYYIPDGIVNPTAYKQSLVDDPPVLGFSFEPLPFVAEEWSPSTGHDDIATKLEGYRKRGDLEIWHIHPYERTLTAWRRHPDGSYTEELYRGGINPVASLPGAEFNLDALVDR